MPTVSVLRHPEEGDDEDDGDNASVANESRVFRKVTSPTCLRGRRVPGSAHGADGKNGEKTLIYQGQDPPAHASQQPQGRPHAGSETLVMGRIDLDRRRSDSGKFSKTLEFQGGGISLP